MLNKSGLRLHPYFNPTEDLKGILRPLRTLTDTWSLSYISLNRLTNLALTPLLISFKYSPFLHTVSYAFLKSTKHTYNFFLLWKAWSIYVFNVST